MFWLKMEMTDETWHLVKSAPKVSGFVGGAANRPAPISEREVQAIMQQMQDGVEKPRPKVQFEVGEQLRVTEGAVCRFQCYRRGCRLRQEPSEGFRADLRSCHAGGSGFFAGRESLTCLVAPQGR